MPPSVSLETIVHLSDHAMRFQFSDVMVELLDGTVVEIQVTSSHGEGELTCRLLALLLRMWPGQCVGRGRQLCRNR